MSLGAATTEPGAPPRLGRYTDLTLLGKGGMGAVYRGRDPALGREVAIKVMNDRSPEFAARFQREAQALARLSHPRIVQVYDCGAADDGSPFFVMELLSGRPVDKLLEDAGRLPWQEVARIMMQAAEGLAAAHAAGIVHRDIKPANLVLDSRGQLKLVDFGIARFATLKDGENALTKPQSLLGTPLYMAPELLSGEVADGRVDIYALGLTGYHLLTGQPPFAAPSAVALVMKQLSEPLPDLSQAAPDVPARLVALIRRMAEKEPKDRVPRCEDVCAELEALLRDPGPQAVVKAAPRPAGTLPLVLGGVGAAAVVAALVALPMLRSPRGTGGPQGQGQGPEHEKDSALPPKRDDSGKTGTAPPNNPPSAEAAAPEVPPAREGLRRGKGPLRVTVLRWKNLGGERDLEMLTEGIGESVTTRLGQERRLRLLERNQIDQALQEIDFGQTRYVDKRTATALGRIAGAEVAVQGGYQRVEGQIRVSARLIHIETGEILDTLSVNHSAKDLFGVQDLVAAELARRLTPFLR